MIKYKILTISENPPMMMKEKLSGCMFARETIASVLIDSTQDILYLKNFFINVDVDFFSRSTSTSTSTLDQNFLVDIDIDIQCRCRCRCRCRMSMSMSRQLYKLGQFFRKVPSEFFFNAYSTQYLLIIYFIKSPHMFELKIIFCGKSNF